MPLSVAAISAVDMAAEDMAAVDMAAAVTAAEDSGGGARRLPAIGGEGPAADENIPMPIVNQHGQHGNT